MIWQNYLYIFRFRCSSYGDSVGSRPICGVDGKDYANMCELHKSSCLANRMIAVKFQGSCGESVTAVLPTGQTIFIDFRLSRLLWRSTAHLTEENIIRLNTNRSVRFGGMPVAFRLRFKLGKKTSLPMRRYVSVGFPACMRIRRKELQFAMSPATRSMPVSTTLAHPLQGPLWIGYVWVNLSKLSRFSPLQRPMISPRGYM